ncbi:hypothetical protein BB559_007122, partial [Furculomyces boomerangus]
MEDNKNSNRPFRSAEIRYPDVEKIALQGHCSSLVLISYCKKIGILTYKAFKNIFTKWFSSASTASYAITKKKQCKQESRGVAEYTNEFSSYRTHGLYICRRLPGKLKKIVDVAVKVENRVKSRFTYADVPLTSSSAVFPTFAQHETTPIKPQYVPMKVDATYIKPRGPLTPSQKQYRSSNNLSLYCRLAGNYVSDINIVLDKIKIPVKALVDSGASASFINIDFMKKLNLPIQKTKQKFTVESIDGKPLCKKAINTAAHNVKISIDNQIDSLSLSVTFG